jgi:mono/diheme cytochrome c family protein
MYRGVIQHRNFVTTFLRRQIEDRGLASPIGLGRIWRIVPDGATLPMRPLRLAAADDATLLAALCHDEGAVRDLALRTLVQQQRHALLPGLREQLRTAPRPALRIAALSALVGLEQLSTEDLRAALRDDDAGVLAFAVEHAGPRLAVGDAMVWLRCEHLAGSAPLPVAWHLALVLGDVLRAPGGCTARRREAALALLARLLRRADTDAGLVAAVATGAGPGELPALLRLFVATAPTLADATLTELVRRAALAREPATIEALLATAGAAAPAQCLAVLQGVRAALPAAPRRIGSLPLAEQELLRAWAGGTDELATVARDLLAAAKLRSEQVAVPTVRSEHSPEQRRLIEQGAGVYARVCAGCHQPDGRGLAGLAPPLRDSEWVLGPVPVLARIVLHGVRGPIEVAGTSWSLEMPGQRQLADAEVAAVAAFLRNSFGHHAAPPTAAEIAAVRAATAGRSEPWTASELAGLR